MRSSGRLSLRFLALGYLTLLVALPLALVFWNTFADGLEPVWETITRPAAMHAFWLTLLIALVAVPANTVFGVLAALAVVRHEFVFKRVLNAVVDLPLAVSPVVIGLALVVVYAKGGWLGDWFIANGLPIIFSIPGMILATMFISLPFVMREVIPVLHEIGTEQEQAAATLGASSWQTLWRVTNPAIRQAIAYGVVLTTARALGEFGAVSLVSGKLAGRTETLTLYVDARFQSFDIVGASTASVVLILMAVLTLVAMNRLARPELEVAE